MDGWMDGDEDGQWWVDKWRDMMDDGWMDG